MATQTIPFVYADKVFTATDLNRDAKRVLDSALNAPVTITRNDQLFSLMSRDLAARSLGMSVSLPQLLAAVAVVSSKLHGQKVVLPSALRWIEAFDVDDLEAMVEEVRQAAFAVMEERVDVSHVEAIFHEWRESGLASLSVGVGKAFRARADREALTPPLASQAVERRA